MLRLTIIGGLGNQLFEVAFAYVISKKTGKQIQVNTSKFKKYKIRKFSLQNFYVFDKISILGEKKSYRLGLICYYWSTTEFIYRIFQRIFKTLFMRDYIGNFFYKVLSFFGLYYNFDNYYYVESKRKNKNINIYGYFQSEKYFVGYENEIKDLFKVKIKPSHLEASLIDEIRSTNAVALSIRIGDDYIDNKYLYICDENYYLRAIENIYNIIENPVIYVFSDDINKVKMKYNLPQNIHYVMEFDDYQQLRIMYNCKHFIISNSSFSRWGAYLSNYESKIIIAPKKWYNNSKNKPDIYLESMKLI